jgi:glycerate-2-kinase
VAGPDVPVDDRTEVALRRDARRIVREALDAVRPAPLVEAALREEPLEVPPGGRLILVGVGKAAPAMARGARAALGDRISRAVLLTTTGAAPDGLDGLAGPGGGTGGPDDGRWVLHRGGHPLPDAGGVGGARAVRAVVRDAGPDDRVLLLLSGGGSALLALPAEGLRLDDLRVVTDALLRAGADIRELNAVRKHLEVLKGGGLAREVAPAPIRALVLSDVPGDPLDVVASGPVTPDASTYADALAVLERHDLVDDLPGAVLARLHRGRDGAEAETPEADDPCFSRVEVRVVGNVGTAVMGAAESAGRLGYRPRILSTAVAGVARDVGEELARLAVAAEGPGFLVQGGETTVRVTGSGKGGRNQEVALSAARVLDGRSGVLLFSLGTDGVDGPTDAAGAVATGSSLARARERGLDADDHLRRNDSYRWFEALGDLIVTGPTGTNVTDVMGALVRGGGEGRG